jgi:hypothetical protein
VDGVVEGERDGDGEGDGDGDGERDGEGDGDGEGVGVPDAGSAWHTVSVFEAVAAVAAWAAGAACAVPSTPTARKLPLSKVIAVTLACAKRIKDRPPTLLVRVTLFSLVIRKRLGNGWAQVLISAIRLHMHHPSPDHGAVGPGPAGGTPLNPVAARQPESDGSRAGSVPWRRSLVPVQVPVASGCAR